MTNRSFLPVFLLISVCTAWLDDRPIFETRDGNLIIASARDRNITFLTSGRSSININDINLIDVSEKARKAVRVIEVWENGQLSDLTNRVIQLENNVNGGNGLETHLAELQMLVSNRTNRPSSSDDQTHNVSMAQLASRVLGLEVMMATLKGKLLTNKCSSSPCQNGGTCIRIYDGVQCLCPSNYEGEYCEEDVDECARFANTDLGCQNGATCTNLPGSYRCDCAPGWHGTHCVSKTVICNGQNSRELCGNGICVPSNEHIIGYRCICDQGWQSEGINPACIKDVDECAGNHPACSINPIVPCINRPGGYTCGECPAGYFGNGYYCSDVDECDVNNGGCSTSPKAHCINTVGSRVCVCPFGYQGDGITCRYMGVCSMNNGGCHPRAGCIENFGQVSPSCICSIGYHGDGVGPYGCVPDATVNPCSSNPCGHGTCESDGESFKCTCVPGYTGIACDTIINPCAKNPCQNNGLCRSTDWHSFTCECTSAFTGATCESKRDPCHTVIKNPTGNLMHPMEGQAYKSDSYCSFLIITNKTSVLKITFTRFDLESTVDCLSSDFLQIHDGANSQAHVKGRFCGSRMPFNGTFTTTSNSVYLGYKTISNDPHTGFALKWETVPPTCGGIFNTDHGIIQSPGSPGKYPDNTDCMWEINVRRGKRISFTFLTMMIEEHPTCDHDYLQINEIAGDRSVQLGRFCNHALPGPISTTGSSAKLYFHSDANFTDVGFQIRYSTVDGTPGCGGEFKSDHGTITTPGYPSKYPPNMICEYKIQLPENMAILFTWVAFEVGTKNPGCRYDSVQMFRGDMDSPIGGKHCGDELPPTFSIDANVVSIVFTSDSSLERQGFQLKYEALCGGVFYEPSGVLMSPYYPESYPSSRTCTYEIIQPPGKRIILTMIAMEINGPTKQICSNDYLAIYDGDNENSTLLGSLCGNAENAPTQLFYSTHNFMFLKFVTAMNTNNRGFLANYTTVDNECGGLLRSPPSGIIEPLIRNGNNGKDVDCIWTLQAPKGYIVELSFASFQLESHSMCQTDYVEIYDGAKIKNRMMGQRRCGKKMPPPLKSQGETMTIVSHSNKGVSSEGFVAHYVFIDASKSCGGHFATATGTMRSPNYPRNYTANRECVWIITAPNKKQIDLEVESFDLEDANCMNDYLELRNGAYETSPLIGRYCGRKIVSNIKSSTNHLYAKFVSDDMTQHRGFSIKWDSSTTGCGGFLTGDHGEIHSPGYPQPYYEGAQCDWKIAIPKGNVIRLRIRDLDFNDNQLCQQDYLEIITGDDKDKKKGSRYCTNNYPAFIDLPSNLATIKFTSLSNNTGRGFALTYETNCVQKVRGIDGVIESPGYPNGYPRQLNCTWIIEAPRGNTIKISFSHFNLEGDASALEKCSSNNLTIEEGDDGKPNTKLATLCDSNILPGVISSTQRQVFLHLATDQWPLDGGFRLEWLTVGCSGRLHKPSGTLTSPNYPSQYPNNVECEWLIETEEGHSVEIVFLDVKLHKSEGCNEDRIEVYGGADANSSKLAQLCRTNNVTRYTSPGNKLFVKFESDDKYSGKGFKAEYKSIKRACGGIFRANDGAIHSPNYPNNYPANSNCEWLIEVDENHVVKLDFADFDVAASGNCTVDYVKIFDGPSRDDELLGTFCSNNLPGSLKSSGNSMLVVFKSSSLLTSKGFRATYTKACGARIVTNSTGILQITSLGDMSKETMNCTWIVMAADPADHITLSFFHLDIANHDSRILSKRSSISVYEGEGIGGPNLGTWLNNEVPMPRTSTGNTLTVHVFATSRTGSYGFGATYSVFNSACGGEYLGEWGDIASPGYPISYPTNVECVWLMKVSPGNPMTIDFSVFELQSSPNCDHDYLEIREDSGIGKLIGTYCGNESPGRFSFLTNLWIKFRSHESGTAKGFLATFFRSSYHWTELSAESGVLASPLYPRYWREHYHGWTINVETNSVIRVQFDEVDMENSDDNNCGMTSVTIYDGGSTNAPELSKGCTWTGLGEPVTTTGDVVYIAFQSSMAIHGSLFRLHWYAVPKALSGIGNKKQMLSECTFEYNMNSIDNNTVIIASPGWPDGYDSNLECTWLFMSPPGYHLVMNFMTIDLDVFTDCMFEHVSVYNGNGLSTKLDDSQLLKKVCRSIDTFTDIVGNNIMTVQFHSEFHINKTGFQASISRECGGELSGPNGVIDFNEIMNMHNGSDHLNTCEWHITVRTGRTIVIKFEGFAAGRKTELDCDSNYVLVKNGAGPDSPNLGPGKICGTEPRIDSLESTGNKVYVKASGYRGQIDFRMTYREKRMACGGYYEMMSTDKELQFNSPNYPNVPASYSDCIWLYRAPFGERLTLRFIERFDLTSDQDCEREYVEVRDGGTELSRLLGRFCGTTTPGPLRTTGDMLYVQFYTEMQDPKNGFKASVTTGEVCGGTITGASGVVESPNYPKSYPTGQQCDWWIIGPVGHVLKLEFNDIHLYTSGENCTDFIAIHEPELASSHNSSIPAVNTLGTFCGFMKPGVLQTSSNKALVTFHSEKEWSNGYRGFSLNFTASKEECGGSLTGVSGEFQSIGYPKLYEYWRYCEWVIEVPEGSQVVLEILDLDISLDIGYLMVVHDKYLHSRIFVLQQLPYPKEISSTSNMMFVNLGLSKGHRGLKARFTAAAPAPCGGLANDVSGNLHLPPSPYSDSDFYCRWKLQAPATTYYNRNETTLTVTISGSIGDYLHRSKFCEYHAKYISIEDGEKNTAMICGNVTTDEPYVVRSATPSNIINVMNGTAAGRMNFNVHYEWTACGGILNGPSHTIRSPTKVTYPKSCVWHVRNDDSGSVISMKFIRMNLGRCDKGYIIVRNGGRMGPQIGKYCGNIKPVDIISSTNQLWIEFWTAEPPGDFEIQLNSPSGGCGGVYRGSNREIATPNFPKPYPNDAECTWEITTEPGFTIELSFVNRFRLETSDDCVNDFVQMFDWIYDKYGIGSWKGGSKYCGQNVPMSLNSTSNRMKLLFRSNDKLQMDGFQATWKPICGGIFEASGREQFIASPSYPDNYPPNLFCNYTLVPPKSKWVYVEFMEFDLERDLTDCTFDSVTLLYWYPSGYYNMPVFCGDHTPDLIRSEKPISIVFKTNPVIETRGFRLKYYTYECGGEITEPTVITRPSLEHRKQFEYGVNCTWVIRAPQGKSVVLRFQKLDLASSYDCLTEKLVIVDGDTLTGLKRGQFCGKTDSAPAPMKSIGNAMTVMYHLAAFVDPGDLEATIIFANNEASGCGGRIDLQNSTLFRTPRVTVDDQLEECHWTVTAGPDKRVRLTINQIDLKNSTNTADGEVHCTDGFLEIRDGGPTGEVIGQYCGNVKPQPITSTTHVLWIRFVADGKFEGEGVEATLDPIDSPCGKSIWEIGNQTQSIIVQSPDYPEDFPAGIQCRWIFRNPDPSATLHLHFLNLDMEDTEFCSGDHIEISDKVAARVLQGFGENFIFNGKKSRQHSMENGRYNAMTTYKYCGQASAIDYYGGSNEIKVLLKTTSGDLPKPRKFKFEVATTSCNRNYTAEQGRIVYEKIHNCSTTITAPPNHTISLYTNKVIGYDRHRCPTNFIQIRYGDLNSPVIYDSCGDTWRRSFYSTGNVLSIHAEASDDPSDREFQQYDMVYTTTDKGRSCGGKLFNYEGVFRSPWAPKNDQISSICEWEISVPRRHQVSLNFEFFNMGTGACDKNYLQVIELKEGGLDETFCSGDTPVLLEASTNTLRVIYVFENRETGTGWRIRFKAVQRTDVSVI